MSGYQRLDPNGSGRNASQVNPFSDPPHNNENNHNNYSYGHRPEPVASPYQDSLYRPPTMSPVHGAQGPFNAQSPSPPPPMQDAYQMRDRSYFNNQPLQIPMGPGPGPGTPSDRLQAQPTYSVENVSNSYGHNEAYREQQPSQVQPSAVYGAPPRPQASGYAIDPQAHHDSYYNQPYQPSPNDDMGSYPLGGHEQQYYQDEADNRPMLHPDDPYGPDPYQMRPTPDEDDHIDTEGGYMDAAGTPQPMAKSPAPVRRWKTVREVQLFQGNLVLDCPVPPRLLNQIPHAPPPERDEFTHMRYTAATCDPADFYADRFTLRQRLFARPRHTELFIVVTMYNEEDELFARTMIGIIQNIEYMNSRKNSKTWGEAAWKKIVVCVVSDGRAKINPRTRAVLAAMGVYQDGIAKQQVNGKDVTAHLYEYTTQMSLEIKKGIVQVKKGSTPVQMLFCLKEKNQKKINSHRWFFQAFGSVLDPNICVLLDCGTRPGKDSIYLLWKAFEKQPNCAGACGEIKAMLSRGKALLNPLVAAQNFEYKISNILDKPLESAFGFISVLPGAFSAYRYVALQNDKTGSGPLEKYFLGEKMHGANAGIFTANMYLAEDRILCFELVAKKNCNWILQYVKGATGETDVPTEMADFIMQRRRWLNGSFFAAVYALTHSLAVLKSGHSVSRKFFFFIEFFYQTVNMLFAWFAIGNFFLVFRILTTSLGDPNLLSTTGTVLAVIFEWLYLITLVSCFILSLGNRPKGSNNLYMTMVWFWVGIMIYLIFAAIYITVRSIQLELVGQHITLSLIFSNTLFISVIASLLATYVLYFVMSLLFLDPWHMFTSFVQYLLLTPTYVNILNVYAFCNTHDVTWGTKGADKPPELDKIKINSSGAVDVAIPTDDSDLNKQYEDEIAVFSRKFVEEKKKPSAEEKQEDYYKGFRSSVVLVWIFCNLALSAVVLNTGGFDRIHFKSSEDPEEIGVQNSIIYMEVVLWTVTALSAFRWVGGFWFLISRLVRGV